MSTFWGCPAKRARRRPADPARVTIGDVVGDVPEAWGSAAAAAALDDVLRGRLDADRELGAAVVMVVDLDRGDSAPPAPGTRPIAGRLPVGFGRIVVAVSQGAQTAPTFDCDMALTTTGDPARPWVAVDRLADAVGRLRACVDANPRAALTAAQLLRRGGTGPPDDDLLCESLAYASLQGGGEFARWLAGRPRRPPGTGRGEPVIVERRGDRLVLTLNRPEVRNAYDASTRDRLVAGLQLAVADDSIREIVLRANGPAFCSGGDLDEFGTTTDPSAAHQVRMDRSAAWWLWRCAARVTVALHGSCIGAGIELPAFAGRVEAATDTVIRLPEVGMGLVPGAGGTASIPRRVGRHRAAWLTISGVDIGARTALAWGLVDRISEPVSRRQEVGN